MQVNCSRRYTAVSQEFLNREDVSAIFQKMDGKGMAERMDRYAPRNASHPKPFLQRIVDRFFCDAAQVPSPWKQQPFRVLCALDFHIAPTAMQFPFGIKFLEELCPPLARASADNSWFDSELLQKRTERLPGKCLCCLC